MICFPCFKRSSMLYEQYDSLQENYDYYQISGDELKDDKNILNSVTPIKCTQISNCQHDTCDFGVIIKTLEESKDYSDKLNCSLNDMNKELEQSNQVIFNLNNQNQSNLDNINNLTNHINWYRENIQWGV